MNQPEPPDRLRRAIRWLALIVVVASGVVFARRGLAVWQAAQIAPGTAVTSGFEEESLLAVWRGVHHQAVYADPTRLPYAAAYFNWLFYAAYAGATGPAARIYGDAIIPLAGRLLTGAGALAGAGCLFWLLRRANRESGSVAAAVSAFVFFGPLVGWWAFTVRPDAWALTCETAALAVLLTGYQRRPHASVLAGALLFYGAWAFKQTYVTGLGAALLFLLVRRQWRPAVLLAALSIALWTATLVLLGPAYRASFRDGGAGGMYLLAAGMENLADLFKKSFPLWLLAAAALGRRTGRPVAPDLAADLRLLGWLGLAVGLPFAFAGSCKVGAYSNYYFSVTLMLALLAAGTVGPGRRKLAVPAALAAAGLLQLLIAGGRLGQIDLRPQAQEHAAIWSVWQAEPEPRFAAATAFNLPWLNPGSPPLVLAFNYQRYRTVGRDFEAGGVGGLIATGYFRSLLLPADTGDAYDTGSLRLYRSGETIGGLTVFRRQDSIPATGSSDRAAP